MKQIKPTKTDTNKVLEAFKKYLSNYKSNSGKISFTYDMAKITNVDIKPQIIFSTKAYVKMNALIDNSKKEIGWHGLVRREGDMYYVEDIIVYPQQVTATTVETDETEYAEWIMSFDDERFNKIKLHGHSHVNMGVTPSNVDTDYYNKMLNAMEDDAFFIFMIMNKRKELNIWLYDYSKNLIFEKNDLIVNVLLDDGIYLHDWYKLETDLMVDEVYPTYKTKKEMLFDEFK